MTIFLTRLKVLLRDKGTLFWILLFPLGMAIFFYMGFGTINFASPVESLQLNIISEDEYKINEEMLTILESLKYDEETDIFKLNYIDTYKNANELYKDGNIDNYFYLNENQYELYSKNTTVTIAVQTVVTEYNNFNYFLEGKLMQGETDINNITNAYFSGLENSFIESKSILDNTKFGNIYFFALISMICLYAAQLGIRVVMDVRADNSAIGIRAGVTPTKRSKLLSIYFLVALFFEICSSTLLVFFIKFILRIEFGNLLLVLIATWLGTILGITAGMMYGSLTKGSRNKKENIIVALVLFSCFLSGLMIYNMKHILDISIGLFSRLNPATPITDALFSLYFYDDYKYYLIDLGFICGLSILFFGIVLIKMRGEKYESL